MSEENVLQHSDIWMRKDQQSAPQDWQESEPVPWKQASVPVRSWEDTTFMVCIIAAHLRC